MLIGAGERAFSVGADLRDPTTDHSVNDFTKYMAGRRRRQRWYDMLCHYPKGIVTAANGYVAGSGLQLALTGDILIGTPSAGILGTAGSAWSRAACRHAGQAREDHGPAAHAVHDPDGTAAVEQRRGGMGAAVRGGAARRTARPGGGDRSEDRGAAAAEHPDDEGDPISAPSTCLGTRPWASTR